MSSDAISRARSLLENPTLSETALPDGTAVILDIDQHQVLSVSPVGAFVIDEIRNGVESMDALTTRIVTEFDVDADRAARDAAAFVAEVVTALSSSER
ncbi:hypothetical protein CKO31_11565 [Thiohalocapsa halophila]|uniref:PqqD family protein n=1 Tax=Thiohalocapsa halophila TaxID=69359 RepID=A0ABS1CHG5_9GAMM|nr:PqqD family peptide modification chaperone [Thiohalocapsa halophila]MBK1631366.1 hypothetical protein [Thiohalocapsa halophila]